MQKQNDLKVKTKITPKVRGMPKKEGKNEKERRSTFSTFSWSKRCVALFLALLSIFTMITPAFAWEVVGESGGGGGSSHSVSSGMRIPNGYSNNGNITKLVGLRFSVYSKASGKVVKNPIDVYTGGHSLGMQKCTPKRSKTDLKVAYKNGNRSLLKGTFASTDTFAANSVACGSAIPENPADVKNWAAKPDNLTKILRQLGYPGGAADLNSNLLLFIEPIFPYKLNNESLIAMTATEAVYVFWQEYNTDKSPSNYKYGQGGNKWSNVGHYTNRYVPSCMYVGDAKAARISEVLGNGSELKSDAFISTIINNAYGLHVCVPNDSPEVKSKKVTLYTAYGFTDEDKKADGKMDYKIQSNLTKSVTVNQGQTVGYTFSKPADTITHGGKNYALSSL